MTFRIRQGCLAAAVLLMISLAQAQESRRLVVPSGVFYYQPAATVFGSEAAWINPAGIPRYGAPNGQIMMDYYEKTFAKSWGGVFSWQDFAVGYRTVRTPGFSNFKEYLIAVGAPVGSGLSIGGSYQKYSGGPAELNKQHQWSVGLLKQGGSAVSWGMVFSNLNQIHVPAGPSEIEQRYSIGYQPMGGKLTAAVDMLLSTKTKFTNAEFVYHAEYTPLPGLFLDASIDSHRSWQIGGRINLLKYFVGSRTRITRTGRGQGSTLFLGATSLRQPSIVKEPAKRLHASISAPLMENPPQPRFGRKSLPYPTLLLSLYRAARDPYIKDVAVYISGSSLGFARGQELRDAFMAIRAAGKEVVCFLSDPGNLSYYVATAADRIIIPPVSQLNLVGLRAEMTFYAGTMDKLGVRADMVKIGPYKSAAEPFSRSASSDENREQMNRLLDDLYGQFVDGIASERQMPPDSVKALIDRGPFTSEEALKTGLVDGLFYANEVDSLMEYNPGVTLADYQRDTVVNGTWKPRPVLAVVVAEGDIKGNDGGSPFGGNSGTSPAKMERGFEQALSDRRVKGIIFRIDSPGGDALASDDIFHSALTAANSLPLVVSMGNDAASGGMYIAVPGRRLFASPGTITGSIGIFGGKPDLSGLYQKLNLGKELYTRGHFAGMMTSIRPFSDEERQKYFDQLNAFYQHFVDLVAGNRGLSRDSIDALGKGRVWTGREAIANGLVDQLGGLPEALSAVANETDISDYDVRIYPVERPYFILPGQPLLNGLISIFSGHPGKTADDAVEAATSQLAGGMYARIPYDLVIE